MNHEPDPMFTDFENNLRQLAPPEPRASAADAAYEAGRLAALGSIQARLTLHRVVSAASLLIALGAGSLALLRPEVAAPRVVATNPVAEPPKVRDIPPVVAAIPQRRLERIEAPTPLPELSYLSLRERVLGEDGIHLDRLPQPAHGREIVAPAPARLGIRSGLPMDL